MFHIEGSWSFVWGLIPKSPLVTTGLNPIPIQFQLNLIYLLLFFFVYEQTRSSQYEHTHSAERRLIKTDETERSTRHWSRRNHRVTHTFCNCIEDRTI